MRRSQLFLILALLAGFVFFVPSIATVAALSPPTVSDVNSTYAAPWAQSPDTLSVTLGTGPNTVIVLWLTTSTEHDAETLLPITDSQDNVWLGGSIFKCEDAMCERVYFTNSTVASSDTITITCDSSCSSGTEGYSWVSMIGVAVSGSHHVNATYGTGSCNSACTTSLTTASTSVAPDSLELALGGKVEECGVATEFSAANADWTLQANSYNPVFADDDGCAGVVSAPSTSLSSSTTFPMSSTTSGAWADFGIELDAGASEYATVNIGSNVTHVLTVDGVPYQENASFTVLLGTVLDLAAPSTVLTAGLNLYDFVHWSQGGSSSQEYTVSGDANLTALYALPAACGSNNPSVTNLNSLLNNGCLWGGGFLFWFSLLGPYFLPFLEFLAALAIYVRTESPAAAVAVYVLMFIVLNGGLYLTVEPASLANTAPALLGLICAGSIFQLLRGQKGG